MRHLPILAAALLLPACQPQAPDGAPAPAPADAPTDAALPPGPTTTDFSAPITARGTEPFWALRIDGGTLTLERMGETPVSYEAPGAAISPGRGEWQAAGPGGASLKVTLYVSECSDGMSDLRYPMTAEVELVTGETLRGCAARSDALPREAAQG